MNKYFNKHKALYMTRIAYNLLFNLWTFIHLIFCIILFYSNKLRIYDSLKKIEIFYKLNFILRREMSSAINKDTE